MARTTATEPTLEQLDQKLERIAEQLDAALPKAPPPFDSTAPRAVLFDESEHRAFLRWLKRRRARA